MADRDGDASKGSDRGGGDNVVDFESGKKRALAARLKRQSSEIDQLIDRYNSRFCVVNANGTILVFENKPDPLRAGFWTLHRYTFADFVRMHQNREVHLFVKAPTVKDPDRYKEIVGNVAQLWLSHPRRREYLGGLVFDPSRMAPKDYFNLWCGLGVTARRGSWKLMQDHVFKVVCASNQQHYEYLLNLAALMIQQPAEPSEVCCVLQGEEGSGKGIFLRALLRIMGQHGLHLSHPEHLRGRHNAHLWMVVMLFADEAFYAGDKQHESVLKALITEESLAIEPKFQDLFQTLNHLHIWMASNLRWVVPVGLRGRRWFILRVSDARVDDSEYFEALGREMANGGFEAMRFDLERRDLSGFRVRNVPHTEAYLEQRLHSLDSINRWWLSVLERGFVWRSKWGIASFRRWDEFYTLEMLVNSYGQWCDDSRLFQRQTRAELREMMARLYRPSRPRRPYPVYEVEQLPPGAGRGPQSDWTEPELGLGDVQVETGDGDDDGLDQMVDVDGLDRIAIVRQGHARGFEIGALEEARDSFLRIVGDIPVAWR
jgi:hypothetical protein